MATATGGRAMHRIDIRQSLRFMSPTGTQIIWSILMVLEPVHKH